MSVACWAESSGQVISAANERLGWPVPTVDDFPDWIGKTKMERPK